MDGARIVQQMVDIIVSGLTSFGTGIAQGVTNFAQALAITGTGNDAQLSVYFVLVLAMAGLAIAISLTTRIFTWLSSLGN